MFGKTNSRKKQSPQGAPEHRRGLLSRSLDWARELFSLASPPEPAHSPALSRPGFEGIHIPGVVNYREGDTAVFDPGGTTGEPFQVIRKLGEGGCGSVYQVEGESRKQYALKILDLWKKQPMEWHSLKQRFEKSYSAGRLGSDYLVKYYHKGYCKSNPAILMEYCGGGDLETRMPDFYKPEQYEPMIVKLLYGLQTLHASGCIHRDIKLKNILFDEVGNPKLTDFDLSAFLNNRTTVSVRGKVKEMWFTPIFAAPESLREKDVYRLTLPPMDMFAFGVTVYHLLTSGKYPWGTLDDFEQDQEAYFNRQRDGEFQPISFYRPDIDPNWAHAIHSCLEPDPGKRMPGPYHFLQMVNHEVVMRRSGGEMPTPAPAAAWPAFSSSAAPLKDQESAGAEEKAQRFGLQLLSGGSGQAQIDLGALLSERAVGSAAELIIGRRDASVQQDIAVDEIPKPNDDYFVSRRHATIRREKVGWAIRDGVATSNSWQGSTNETEIYNAEKGTYENISGQGYRKLEAGDIITLAGEVKLKFITL